MQIVDADTVIEDFGFSYFRELSTFGALSDEVIGLLLKNGRIEQLNKGEYITHFDEEAAEFQVVLKGRFAYYKRCEGRDVLTRYFNQGEQIGFDLMIGLISSDGTDVAVEDSLILNVSKDLFHALHINYPAEFGILMITLARELAREIEMLENVIGRGTGWLAEDQD
jgi:CRP-like cAMP-binding protein